MPERRNENKEQNQKQNASQGGPSSNSRDLKEREYRDKQGNIHHHTHTSGEMKDKDKRAA